jgi:hypothetical protein
MSSASRNAMYALRAAAMPVFRAAAGPPFVRWTSRTRGSSIAATIAGDSSVLPSSTTITSRSATVWRSALSTVSRMNGAAL